MVFSLTWLEEKFRELGLFRRPSVYTPDLAVGMLKAQYAILRDSQSLHPQGLPLPPTSTTFKPETSTLPFLAQLDSLASQSLSDLLSLVWEQVPSSAGHPHNRIWPVLAWHF